MLLEQRNGGLHRKLINIDHYINTKSIGCGIMNEQRDHKRTQISHPLVYTAIDEDGNISSQGMAIAVDISPNGMMIETTEPIHAKAVKIRTATSQTANVETTGEIIYSLPHAPKKYRTGLRFNRATGQRSQFANQLLNQ